MNSISYSVSKFLLLAIFQLACNKTFIIIIDFQTFLFNNRDFINYEIIGFGIASFS